MKTSTPTARARRTARAIGIAGALGLVLSGSVVTAHAAPATKFFTAAVTPGEAAAGVAQQAFTVTLTNCGSQTPGCAKASQQSLGSANITLGAAFANVSANVTAAGWYVVAPVVGGVVELRSSGSGAALPPGQSIAVSVLTDTPAVSGIYTWTTLVKQSNDFSGSGNDFALRGTMPQVTIGMPHHLVFATQPSTVQVSAPGSPASYICPAPSVQVVAADGSPVTAGTADVTVLADAGFGNPGLAGTTTVATTAGLATFGTPSCDSGLSAANLGAGYRLRATAIWSLGTFQATLSTTSPSAAFDVLQVRTVCQPNQTCQAAVKGSHTAASVVASAAGTSDVLEFAIGVDSIPADTTCLPANQPSGLEVVRVVVANRDKTVTLTFDKFLVQQIPDNGTPRFPICFAAPWDGWKTASGGDPILNAGTNEFEGLLPNCGEAGLALGNPCVVSRRKKAASEVVTVSIPFLAGRADPKLW